jgi:glycosyltransferase involved in cell wall biosynthesis
MNPLVSVLMPCYNATATLGLALASLRAQTYQNWECILVDDGSVDRPDQIVEQFRDSRIRYVRLETNRGRPHARNLATSMAKGDLLTMLDADDWIYPDKLERQVQIIEANQSLTVVSTCMGIVDSSQRLVGVRGRGPSADGQVFYGDASKLQAPPMPFAPSMFRARDVEGLTFNTHYEVGEDFDYLLRLTLGRRYAIIRDVKYVYTEWNAISLRTVLMALVSVRKMFTAYREPFPVRSHYLAIKTSLKMPIYWTANRVGLWKILVAQRCRRPTAEELEQFSQAFQAVCAGMTAGNRSS